MLTARAGARDPSAIPSISRISTALQYNSGKVVFGSSSLLFPCDDLLCYKLC
jgi:hypothetical protein